MKCPVCKEVNLVMSEKQGVEIDYCPECRGVWLDRGELDKITEKINNQLNDGDQQRSKSSHSDNYNENSTSYEKKDHYNNEPHHDHKKRKKESVFSNIFDVFGD